MGGSAVLLPLYPLIWLCIPQAARAAADVKRRAVFAVLSQACSTVFWVSAAPLLGATTAITSSEGAQSLLVVALLCLKLLWEWVGHRIAVRLSADIMPIFIWLGCVAYELALCEVLCRGDSWLLFAELVTFDAVENIYHLWSLKRQKDSRLETGKVEQGREQLILSQLVLKECLELAIPALVLFTIAVLYMGPQRQFNDIVCSMSPAQFRAACGFLILDLAVEGAIGIAAFCMLRGLGAKPLQMLGGIVATNFETFFTIMWCGFMLFLCRQYTHFGADYRFQFGWLRDPPSEWVCGLKWA